MNRLYFHFEKKVHLIFYLYIFLFAPGLLFSEPLQEIDLKNHTSTDYYIDFEYAQQEILALKLINNTVAHEIFLNQNKIASNGVFNNKEGEYQAIDLVYTLPIKYLKRGNNVIRIHYFKAPKTNIKAQIGNYKKIYKSYFFNLLLFFILLIVALITGIYFYLLQETLPQKVLIARFGNLCMLISLCLFLGPSYKYIFLNFNWLNSFIFKKIELFSYIGYTLLFFIFSNTFLLKNPFNLIKYYIPVCLLIFVWVFSTSSYFMLNLLFYIFLAYFSLFLIFFIKCNYSIFYRIKKEHITYSIGIFLFYVFIIIDFIQLYFHTILIQESYLLAFCLMTILSGLSLRDKIKFFNLSVEQQFAKIVKLTHFTPNIRSFKKFSNNISTFITKSLGYQNTYLEFISKDKKIYKFQKSKNLSRIIEVHNLINPKEKQIQVYSSLPCFNLYYVIYIPIFYKIFRGCFIIAISKAEILQHHLDVLNLLSNFVVHKFPNLEFTIDLDKKIKKRTKEITLKNEELEKSNLARTKLYASITHDIRTPLSLITMPLDKLLRKITESNTFSILNKIKFNIYRVIDIISSTLDIAKLELNTINLNWQYNDFIKFCHEFIQEYFEITDLNNKKLNIKIPSQSVYTKFDPEKIEKVFLNLLSNAIKYSKKDQNIAFELNIQKNYIEVLITNYGYSIPDHQKEKIFHPFYRIDSSQIGTGLGLPICKEYIQLHKGKLLIKTQKNKSTTFVIHLPLIKKDQNDIPKTNFSNTFYNTLQKKEMFSAFEAIQSNINSSHQKLLYFHNFAKEHSILKELQNFFDVDMVSKSKIKKFTIEKRDTIFCIFIHTDTLNMFFNTIKKISKEQHLPIILLLEDSNITLNKDFDFIDMVIQPPYHLSELLLKINQYLVEQDIRLKLHNNK